jgi:hypothetical protein
VEDSESVDQLWVPVAAQRRNQLALYHLFRIPALEAKLGDWEILLARPVMRQHQRCRLKKPCRLKQQLSGLRVRSLRLFATDSPRVDAF